MSELFTLLTVLTSSDWLLSLRVGIVDCKRNIAQTPASQEKDSITVSGSVAHAPNLKRPDAECSLPRSTLKIHYFGDNLVCLTASVKQNALS